MLRFSFQHFQEQVPCSRSNLQLQRSPIRPLVRTQQFRCLSRKLAVKPSALCSTAAHTKPASNDVQNVHSLVAAPASFPGQHDLSMALPLSAYTEGAADDSSLGNPLQRMERLGTSWFGVIMELEGVCIEPTREQHERAWLSVATEFGYPRPLGQQLQRTKGLTDEAVVMRVFRWTQLPAVAKKLAKRKQAVYAELLGMRQPAAMLETAPFLAMLKNNRVPIALACTAPEQRVKDLMQRYRLLSYFDALITAEDSGAAEPEYGLSYAAQLIKRPPMRCIVIGENNGSVEAAHELGMKAIVVANNHPVYNFVHADLVVRDLSQISFLNLKRLFGNEELVESQSHKEASPPNVEEEDDEDALRDEFDDDDDSSPFSSRAAAASRRFMF